MDSAVESCWCCVSCVENQSRLHQGRSIGSLYNSPTKTGASGQPVLHGGGALTPEHLPRQPAVGGTPSGAHTLPPTGSHTLEMCRHSNEPGEPYTNTSGHTNHAANNDVGSPNHLPHTGAHDPAGPLECLPPGVTFLPQYNQV